MALSKVTLLCLESNLLFLEDIFNLGQSVPSVNRKRNKSEVKSLNNEYRKYPDKFFDYTRMTVDTFDYILLNIEPVIRAQINCKRAIQPAEKLFITLGYLGHGASARSLAQSYRLGRSTIAKTIYQTLLAIWKTFVRLHMPRPTSEDLKNIANKFYLKWQYPNCFGSIDGKRFPIKIPPYSGGKYYNHKRDFSLVLQGISDADYKFIAIEVCSKGKKSGDGTFHCSRLNSLLKENRFNVPPPQNLPNSNIYLPHVLIGDEAYPLRPFLMRPYASKKLNDSKITFNKRLSKARVTIECAFGILTTKFRIFLNCIEANIKHATLIIKVSCLLHNIIRERDGDRDEHFCQFWSNYSNSDNAACPRTIRSRRNNRITKQATNIRDQFQHYFITHPI